MYLVIVKLPRVIILKKFNKNPLFYVIQFKIILEIECMVDNIFARLYFFLTITWLSLSLSIYLLVNDNRFYLQDTISAFFILVVPIASVYVAFFGLIYVLKGKNRFNRNLKAIYFNLYRKKKLKISILWIIIFYALSLVRYDILYFSSYDESTFYQCTSYSHRISFEYFNKVQCVFKKSMIAKNAEENYQKFLANIKKRKDAELKNKVCLDSYFSIFMNENRNLKKDITENDTVNFVHNILKMSKYKNIVLHNKTLSGTLSSNCMIDEYPADEQFNAQIIIEFDVDDIIKKTNISYFNIPIFISSDKNLNYLLADEKIDYEAIRSLKRRQKIQSEEENKKRQEETLEQARKAAIKNSLNQFLKITSKNSKCYAPEVYNYCHSPITFSVSVKNDSAYTIKSISFSWSLIPSNETKCSVPNIAKKVFRSDKFLIAANEYKTFEFESEAFSSLDEWRNPKYCLSIIDFDVAN